MPTLLSFQVREYGWNITGIRAWAYIKNPHQRLPGFCCFSKLSSSSPAWSPCVFINSLCILLQWNFLCVPPSSIPQTSCPRSMDSLCFLFPPMPRVLWMSPFPSLASSPAVPVLFVLFFMPRFCLSFYSQLLPLTFVPESTPSAAYRDEWRRCFCISIY